MEAKVVLYPSMYVSHMIPMVQLAKLFVKHGVSVEIAVMNSPLMPASTSNLISKVSFTNPEILFHKLPPLPAPPKPASSPITNMLNTIQSNNENLKFFLRSLSETRSIAGLILDVFCVDALDVAAELHLPAYIFEMSAANSVAVHFRIQELIRTCDWAKKDDDETPIVIPGIPLLHLSDIPPLLLSYGTEDQMLLTNAIGRKAEAKGILINTFESLEQRAVKTLKDGLSLANRPTPPIYCIGPLVTIPDEKEMLNHPCVRWLDAQPKRSVVLLSFGSEGNFSVDQLREIAFAIEECGHKFIWVVRNPPSHSLHEVSCDPLAEPDLDALLPEGFLDRTKEQGIVLKSWAPQAEILHHGSVGGFVSHCGWSSALEAITNAVPIICWPLYAEQKMIRVFLVKEMRIGVELKGSDEGFVSREELAEKVRWLMESEGGNELRTNACTHKINGLNALREGGTSEMAFLEFLSKLEI